MVSKVSQDSLLVRAPDSWSKGCKFKSQQMDVFIFFSAYHTYGAPGKFLVEIGWVNVVVFIVVDYIVMYLCAKQPSLMFCLLLAFFLPLDLYFITVLSVFVAWIHSVSLGYMYVDAQLCPCSWIHRGCQNQWLALLPNRDVFIIPQNQKACCFESKQGYYIWMQHLCHLPMPVMCKNSVTVPKLHVNPEGWGVVSINYEMFAHFWFFQRSKLREGFWLV